MHTVLLHIAASLTSIHAFCAVRFVLRLRCLLTFSSVVGPDMHQLRLTQYNCCAAAELPSAEASQATVSTTELMDPLAPPAAADDVLSDGHVSSSR